MCIHVPWMTIRITIPFWPDCQALKCHNHPAILGNISQLPTCSNTCQHVPSVCKVSKLTSFQIPASAGYMVQWCWYCQPIYIYIFLYISVCCYGCLYSTWCLLVASATPIKDGAMGSCGLKHLIPWCHGEKRGQSLTGQDRGQDCPSKPKSVVQIMWVKQQ